LARTLIAGALGAFVGIVAGPLGIVAGAVLGARLGFDPESV